MFSRRMSTMNAMGGLEGGDVGEVLIGPDPDVHASRLLVLLEFRNHALVVALVRHVVAAEERAARLRQFVDRLPKRAVGETRWKMRGRVAQTRRELHRRERDGGRERSGEHDERTTRHARIVSEAASCRSRRWGRASPGLIATAPGDS